MHDKALTHEQIVAAASLLRVEPAVVYAVRDVEAGPSGFGPDGLPLILYEGHIFSRYTGRRYDQSHPHLSWRGWRPGRYDRSQAQRWAKFDAAATLDAVAAIKATSWGLFQVMGFNARICGWPDEAEFFEDMHRNEAEHLRAFIGFVQFNGLDDELRRHDWAGFAEGYNGAGYKQNRYDEKLARAYARHA